MLRGRGSHLRPRVLTVARHQLKGQAPVEQPPSQAVDITIIDVQHPLAGGRQALVATKRVHWSERSVQGTFAAVLHAIRSRIVKHQLHLAHRCHIHTGIDGFAESWLGAAERGGEGSKSKRKEDGSGI